MAVSSFDLAREYLPCEASKVASLKSLSARSILSIADLMSRPSILAISAFSLSAIILALTSSVKFSISRISSGAGPAVGVVRFNSSSISLAVLAISEAKTPLCPERADSILSLAVISPYPYIKFRLNSNFKGYTNKKFVKYSLGVVGRCGLKESKLKTEVINYE